jgi:hypothetical protein
MVARRSGDVRSRAVGVPLRSARNQDLAGRPSLLTEHARDGLCVSRLSSDHRSCDVVPSFRLESTAAGAGCLADRQLRVGSGSSRIRARIAPVHAQTHLQCGGAVVANDGRAAMRSNQVRSFECCGRQRSWGLRASNPRAQASVIWTRLLPALERSGPPTDKEIEAASAAVRGINRFAPDGCSRKSTCRHDKL